MRADAPRIFSSPTTPTWIGGRLGFWDEAGARMLPQAEQLRWLPPLTARLAMGVRFIAAGGGKLVFYFRDFETFVHEGAKMGLSAGALRIGVPLLSMIELIAGTMLLFGLRARLAAAALLATLGLYSILEMIQAGGLLRRDEAFDLAVYAILLLWLAIEGAGEISLDARRRRSLAGAAE